MSRRRVLLAVVAVGVGYAVWRLPATQRFVATVKEASARREAELREAGYAAVVSGAGPSVIALVTGEFDVSRWRRAGFDVDFVPVCTTGAHLLP